MVDEEAGGGGGWGGEDSGVGCEDVGGFREAGEDCGLGRRVVSLVS